MQTEGTAAVSPVIAPGRTIGIVGGGQLGRMLAQAAQRMGYRVHTFEPEAGCPASAVSNKTVHAPYTDTEALAAFAADVEVVTYEFENIPGAALRAMAERSTVFPHWSVLEICQDRSREKNWLRANGIPHVPFVEVSPDGDLDAAVRAIGFPCVIKTAAFGYDGKGQMKVAGEDGLELASAAFANKACVVEKWVEFSCELSVVCARTPAGETRPFPVSENIHTRHILDYSIVPARVPQAKAREAQVLAASIADRIGAVGLLAVELFLTTAGELLVNELAPRPHNSGHYTLDATFTSQFEQHVRAVCGWPLGDPRLLAPVVMVNLLGDLWARGEPDWRILLREENVKLHLYGKKEARTGRKMGHYTVVGPTLDEALQKARRLQAALAADGRRVGRDGGGVLAADDG